MKKQNSILFLFFCVLSSVVFFSCQNRIKIDPENKATALVNGKKWEANVELTEKDGLWEFYLFVNDKEGITRERMFFDKVPIKIGINFLNRRTLTEIDTCSSSLSFYGWDGDIGGGGFYAVRVEGSPDNWLKINKYDTETGSIEAEFQGTYVKCDAEYNVYGGDSLIFTNGKIKATVKR